MFEEQGYILIEEKGLGSTPLRAREKDLLDRIKHLREEKRILGEISESQRKTIREQREQIQEIENLLKKVEAEKEELKAQNQLLRQEIFGKKSEKRDAKKDEDLGSGSGSGLGRAIGDDPKRKRGNPMGQKGHGRRIPDHLETEEIIHEVPEEDRRCKKCGKPWGDCFGEEESYEVHWKTVLICRIHKRKRYHPGCSCGGVPGIITAPGPLKLIPKGKFSIGFWVNVLLEKYLFQRSLYRVIEFLKLEGLEVSSGTLIGGLQRIGELLQPLYGLIMERGRQGGRWHMDETRWMVFEEFEGKKGYRWWLWVVVTKEVCGYILDPTRSGKVPKDYFGEDSEGIINVDRYSSYQVLNSKMVRSYCWAHERRDFDRIEKGYVCLEGWAQTWKKRINFLYHLNEERLAVQSKPIAFSEKDQKLRAHLEWMEQTYEQELKDPDLHLAQRKVLESMKEHWEGLLVFVDHPEVPMDNNAAERALRNPVIGRKNYYGSGSIWSGMLAMMCFTIHQTYWKNDLNPKLVLQDYFEACAKNQGKPPLHPETFLPWNLSQEQKQKWKLQKHPP